MANIIDAIINLTKEKQHVLESNKLTSKNEVVEEGIKLEEYVKDLFANTRSEKDEKKKILKIANAFSFQASTSNPPDLILKGGDAIEVKKLEHKNDIQLNSSYPKQTIKKSSTMITEECRKSDDGKWEKKDLFYVIGEKEPKKTNLKSLFFIYGDCFAASEDIYTSKFNEIKNKVSELYEDEEEPNTVELGRFNGFDPLDVTSLRIRGMWIIKNPWKVFDYLFVNEKEYEGFNDADFKFCAIIKNSKYKTFENIDKLEEIAKTNNNLKIKNMKIKNPDNIVKLINVKVITYYE